MNKVLVLMMLPLLLSATEWQSLNGPPAGRADDMSIGLYEGEWVIYAADSKYKLYKSTNEGELWGVPTDDERVDNPICVITEPNDAQVVYIGKHPFPPNTDCVWKSTDGGETWTLKDDGITNTKPLCFAMDPNDADIVYLGCESGDCAVFRTDDGGDNWEENKIIPSTGDPSINDLAIHSDPYEGTTIHAASRGAGSPNSEGIWTSYDGGSTWEQTLSDVKVYSVEFACATVAYASADNGVYKGTKPGGYWRWDLTNNNSFLYSIIDLAVISVLDIYAAEAGKGIHVSDDGGDSWTSCNGTADNIILDRDIVSLINHPGTQNTMFAGTNHTVYKTSDAGSNWYDCTKGWPVYDIDKMACNSDMLYCIGECPWHGNVPVISRQLNEESGFRTCATEGEWFNGCDRPYLIDIIPDYPDTVIVGWLNGWDDSESPIGGMIQRTTNGGVTWNEVYSPLGNITESHLHAITANELASSQVYAGFDYDFAGQVEHFGFVRSTDYGGNWIQTSNGLGDDSVFSIVVDPLVWDLIYVGTSSHGVYKSTNNGSDWIQTAFNNRTINALAIDFDNPDTIYAGSENDYGIYKTTDGFASADPANNGLDYLYITDLEIDADEPTIVYALCKEYESASETYVYCTVDRAGRWFDISDGLPTDKPTRDLEIDRDEPDPVYAATKQGVYTYTPDFNKSLVSSSKEASAFNNGRNMIRIEDTYEFWVTYESGGVIYVVRSTNAGLSWSKKMEVGQGCNPAISIRTGIPDVPPCVVWLAKDQEESQDVIFFARHISGQKWTAPAQIKISQYGVDFGPPSFVIDNSNYGHLVYADGSSVKYTKFNIYNPNPTTSETVGDGEDPCIGFMTGSTEPPIHVVWEDDAAIKYRARTVFGWASIDNISSSNSHHPSLEIGGNNVYLVWENDRSIYWCYATYTGSSHGWSRYLRVDDTSDPSIYPTLTSGYACAWVDEVTGNYEEVYLSYYDPEQGEWVVPINISTDSDELYSNYPHIVHRQVPNVATTIYFIWTEGSETVIQPTAPPYDIVFENYVIWETDGGQSEALPFYVADGGEENASPFNLRRDGYHQYGVEPYKRIDYDEQYLKYQFANLKPKRLYELGAYLYQHGYSNLHISAMVDNYQTGAIVLPADTLVILRHMLPTILYEDSTINITIFGNNAVSAILVLSEFEQDNKGGGPQGTEGLSGMPDCFSLHAYPCPASKSFFMEYAVPLAGVVHVTLYDVAGRSVQEICNTYCEPGIYQKRVDLEGIAQGVYFLRLESNKEVVTKKVIVLQ